MVLLFQLPRVVVENDQLQDVAATETHSLEIPSEVSNRMGELRRFIEDEKNPEKKANFALSLAKYYLDYAILDSAVAIGKRIEHLTDRSSEIAVDIYFKAFERSHNQQKAQEYATLAREKLKLLLDKDPTNLLLKNRLAMTLVVTDNPMAGVSMLREILALDPNNRQAILNLGLLAIQSGQFQRAKERFEKLVSLDPVDFEAKLYLAVSMIEINQQKQARLLLEEILSANDSIPAIKMMAMEYLNGL